MRYDCVGICKSMLYAQTFSLEQYISHLRKQNTPLVRKFQLVKIIFLINFFFAQEFEAFKGKLFN